MQTTLKTTTTLVGLGLHSGRPARLVLHPATEGGIRFRRIDVTDRDNVIPARYDLVSDTTLNTRLTNAAGTSVSTVEHLMAAFAGTGVTHALVDIDGPEVPIMDGSSLRFVQDGDPDTSQAKIALVRAVGVVISCGLAILGVTPAKEMR